MMNVESYHTRPSFIEPEPSIKAAQSPRNAKTERVDRNAQEIAQAIWRDFKEHIVSLKPLSDHMFPYCLVGAVLLDKASAPYNAGAIAIVMSVCAYRALGIFERAERIEENEILVEKQKNHISRLSSDLQMANFKIQNLNLQLQEALRVLEVVRKVELYVD